MDTYSQLMEYRELTDKAIDDMRKSGLSAAARSRDYDIALAKKELELRERDLPIGLIHTLAKGDEYVANLKFALDCAEVTYKADHEAVMSYKKRADDLRDMYAREWSQAGER